jgi:hypothetical protein
LKILYRTGGRRNETLFNDIVSPMVYVWTHCDFESIFNIHNRKLGTSLVGYELEKVRIDMESVYRSRLLRIRFSAGLTMYWFPVCHFRCKEFKSLVIWIRNQNIAISTIFGTSSHIKCIFVISLQISVIST